MEDSLEIILVGAWMEKQGEGVGDVSMRFAAPSAELAKSAVRGTPISLLLSAFGSPTRLESG